VRDVDLHLLVVLVWLSEAAATRSVHWVIKFLADLKETSLYLLFNLWLQFLFHVVHLELLALEMLQRVLLFERVLVTWLLHFLWGPFALSLIIVGHGQALPTRMESIQGLILKLLLVLLPLVGIIIALLLLHVLLLKLVILELLSTRSTSEA
jgi:hypothetical protein